MKRALINEGHEIAGHVGNDSFDNDNRSDMSENEDDGACELHDGLYSIPHVFPLKTNSYMDQWCLKYFLRSESAL
jgi:hypothetical protein